MAEKEYTRTDLALETGVRFAIMWPTYSAATAWLLDERFLDRLFGAGMAFAITYTSLMAGVDWYTKMYKPRKKRLAEEKYRQQMQAFTAKELEPARQHDTIDNIVNTEEERVLKL